MSENATSKDHDVVTTALTRERMSAGAPRLLIAGMAILLTAVSAAAQGIPGGQLGPAPRVTETERLTTVVPREAPNVVPPVDRANRQAVVNFYNSVYVPARAVSNDWNGSVTGCNAGATSPAYASGTMDMVNYFRAMTGLPSAVVHEAGKDDKAQRAALMMTANSSLSHSPPTTWTCYTADGAEAAGKSNLSLGAAGANAITLYVADPGTSNTALGHRRWVLYPPQSEMGTGSTGNANALWVISSFGSRPATPPTVAWPPAGFVPYQLVYPRWSFSVNTNATVNFSSASVVMAHGGLPVPLTVLANADGYGDKTIAWEPVGLSFTGGAPDDALSVQVNNVVVGGIPTNYSYVVTVIDPALVVAPTFTDDPIVARTTPVKAIHITELRQAVNALRGRYGLGAYMWSDATLASGVSVIRATHIVELRAALAAVYSAAARMPPTYMTRTLDPGVTIVTTADLAELRAAVLAIW